MSQSIPKIGQIYRHWKGTSYIVTNVSTDELTGGTLITYRNITEGKQWTRPVEGFLSKDENGKFKFTLVSNAELISEAVKKGFNS